jgi:WD40 repeat protein
VAVIHHRGRASHDPHRHSTRPHCSTDWFRLNSRDGATLATVDGLGVTRIWTGEQLQDLQQGDPVLRGNIRFSPDGTLLAGTATNGLTIWSLETGESQVVSVHDVDDRAGDGELRAFDFSPDGRFVAMTLVDENYGYSVAVWDLDRAMRVYELPATQGADSVAFAADEWSIAYYNSGRVSIIDVSFLLDPYMAVCEHIGRDLSEEEWKTYLPDLDFGSLKICA